MNLLSTCYMPSVAYMALLAGSGNSVTIERMETYHRQTMRNRCMIATANGIKILSVPVVCPQGNHTKTGEVKIDYSERWQTIHWRTLQAAYNASPYFIYYQDSIEKLLTKRHDWLVDLNYALTEQLAKLLKISCSMIFSDSYVSPDEAEGDLRDAIDKHGKCTLFQFPQYHQVFGDRHGFAANLSVLDLLFNLGPEAKDYIKMLVANTQAY